MSKVKNYYWDEAEKYIDQLITKIKNDELTVESAVAEAQKTDHVDFNFVASTVWMTLVNVFTMRCLND